MQGDGRLGIEISYDGDTAIITLSGELDLATAPLFSAQFERTAAKKRSAVVVDLSQLEFMDSTGLRSLLMAHEHCETSRQPFAVVPGGRQVARLLEITRVGEHLNFISSPSDLATQRSNG
jgi:anti-sigma B factor antagonist